MRVIAPEDLDKELAFLAKDFGIVLPKEYVEAMWQILDEKDRYQVLLEQMEVFDLDEIANKFGELGGVYKQFSERTRHKYSLYHTQFNEALCEKLMKRRFLSSCDITKVKVGIDHITFESKYERWITGNVRKKLIK